ncbi:T9SS type B sorting domain-containing protein, partial [Neptunitalea chrysea]|uniref:T9SS type B sorting domain-containing protein n=1 Tax=Neptunitalea chrysea TaxID=1647581 RepID=UPI002492FF82
VEVTTEHCDNYYEIVVNEASGCIIPQGISPGNDNKNESFDLDGFDISRITIYNRLGSEVYTRINYVDEWHGQTSTGEELPVGTYFYVLEQRDGTNITGWVYVNREN